MPPNVNVTTTTNQFLAEAWVDQVLRDNRFFGEIVKGAERWKGSQMLMPMKYQKGVATVAFNGFDELPINQIPTTVNMFFYPSFAATNVALSGTDISVNKNEGNGTLKTIDLMITQTKSRAQDAADDWGNYFQGDGSADNGKAPMGLAGIVDDGSDLSQYGGLSRATYSGLNASVVAASGGTFTLLQLRQLWNTISDGSIEPNFAITDYNTWAIVENTFSPIQRNMMTSFEASKMMAPQTASLSGYADLVWDGIKVLRDKKTASGVLYLLNLDYLKWYGLKWYEGTAISLKTNDIVGNVYEDSMYDVPIFSWTGWIKAYNGAALNGFVIAGGQLICNDPFRQGKLTGITTS